MTSDYEAKRAELLAKHADARRRRNAAEIGSKAQIEIGAVVGPITTTEYVAGIGVLNNTGNINGLFANANVVVIGAGDEGWIFAD